MSDLSDAATLGMALHAAYCVENRPMHSHPNHSAEAILTHVRETSVLSPSTDGGLDVERLARHLGEELEESAPRKIEGGSPARSQWLADVLAVQAALHEIGADRAFAEFFGPDQETMNGGE